jgi:hypothetical protein
MKRSLFRKRNPMGGGSMFKSRNTVRNYLKLGTGKIVNKMRGTVTIGG